jgi:integrase/recombinase XerD
MSYYDSKISSVFASLDGAYAPNTLRSYYADAKVFVDWCEQTNIAPFPLTSDTVRAFIEHIQLQYNKTPAFSAAQIEWFAGF